MVVQLAVVIQVEVSDHEDEVFGRDLPVAIFSLKLANFFCSDVACVVAVDPLECRVRFEVSNCCQDLPHFLDSELLLGVEEQELLEFQL